ncbi:toll/interleukin-1 receptor domain-containing protein [Nocardiopsis alba]|uniref:toll/interleukin-1 receptor domain-containing protein n=1 Tax=Nocardiopsis alba TaxID=53437 RepID=UPI003D714C53
MELSVLYWGVVLVWFSGGLQGQGGGDSVEKIFINYRKSGGAYAAALLDHLLCSHFGEEYVFRASRSIGPGVDYTEALREAVSNCKLMLVVVDEHWQRSIRISLGSTLPCWQMEVREAIRQKKRVIPVLLSGVGGISEFGLPADISQIARLQYMRFDYRNPSKDVDIMASALRGILSEGESEARNIANLPSLWSWE